MNVDNEVVLGSYIERAREALAVQTQAHRVAWGFGAEQMWLADLDNGIIEFDFADGLKVAASIQVVGSYNTEDGTFLWGWDHPSIPDRLRRHALLARQWGEQVQASLFIERKVECSEDDAWSFAAVTNMLAEANGIYRGRAGATDVFMTLGRLTMNRVAS